MGTKLWIRGGGEGGLIELKRLGGGMFYRNNFKKVEMELISTKVCMYKL